MQLTGSQTDYSRSIPAGAVFMAEIVAVITFISECFFEIADHKNYKVDVAAETLMRKSLPAGPPICICTIARTIRGCGETLGNFVFGVRGNTLRPPLMYVLLA